VFSKPIAENFFPERAVPAGRMAALEDAGSVVPPASVTSEKDPPAPRRKPTAARDAGDAGEAEADDADPSEARVPRSPSVPLAGAEGQYFLVSYTINGAPQPLRGSMNVTRTGDDRLELTSNVLTFRSAFGHVVVWRKK
jgi:hypothetical protein